MPLEHELSYLPIIQSPLVQPEKDDDVEDIESARLDSHSSPSPKPEPTPDASTPQFRRFQQSTNIELFYDLFFVANLTVFTYEHEVNDGESLKQYVGFFCIIWFTWYQVSLYDVRFFMDSVFERVCKAMQFLVMIGFAVVGPEFNPGEEVERGEANGEGPSLIYFALYFARNYKKVVLPMLLLVGTYFVAAMVYLGLYWTFHLNSTGENHTYIVWYVIAVLETILATAVSVVWRNLSFQGTHLVERMSLLTLIIFGEGAIGIARACQNIVYSDDVFDFVGPVAAAIVCAVFNLYFVCLPILFPSPSTLTIHPQMYMIYFDWQHEELFGTIRQQIWSFLHFPLHVALVLAVEGFSQCITWTAAVRRNNALLKEFNHWNTILDNFTNPDIPPSSFQSAATALNHTALELLDRSLSRSSALLATSQGIGYYYQTNDSAIPTIAAGPEDLEGAYNAFAWLLGILFNTVFKIAGFEPPASAAEINEAVEYLQGPLDFDEVPHDHWRDQSVENITKAWTVFEVTFVYFYVTMGSFLVLCTVLAWLNRGRKTKLFMFRLVFTAVVGLGIALLATMDATGTVGGFVLSAWLLPTITICLFVDEPHHRKYKSSFEASSCHCRMNPGWIWAKCSPISGRSGGFSDDSFLHIAIVVIKLSYCKDLSKAPRSKQASWRKAAVRS
ncbi:hypothetical protein M409DRAFT_54194 [Zasmidium cellare ATCC 36951]|uniref:Uncharacterized protein n=1 Tax=Zasmidium cellare ATCC 36951 TaxID=1080233 RepID=A0A6A6CPC3_ZASCE|nr:uncharacterized protein M409DRAFT_54194 [Zasmidium cellare ATCC 36951]KAF2167609.1 hypothetical protein M409DRAFT_54194 [Zasmidium cellare ATCC 36951]